MTIKENVTLYKCDYCRKKMQVKAAMERHEKLCYMRPENKSACTACIHLEEIKVEYTTFYPTPWGEYESQKTSTGFRCKKLDKLMYHQGAVVKGLVEKYPETFEGREKMPVECKEYQYFI